jgi:hypothetical protein
MNFSKYILVFVLSISTSNFLQAQELNCNVQILSPTIQGTLEKRIFQTLQQQIFEFVNNTRWTSDVFKPEEKIECSYTITINKKDNDIYDANIQVAANRPVINTAYKSLELNIIDNNLKFQYIEFQPLEFKQTGANTQLVAVLAYYAFIILGTDYDTYSLEGGTANFVKAQQIVANMQNTAEVGWKAFEGTKNRYWLVENTLNQQFKPMRECMYKYHRLGFDAMAKDMIAGRAAVVDALMLLNTVFQLKPGSYNMALFFLAKNKEIVELFMQAPTDEKTKVVNLLTQIDPGNSNNYQKIMQSGN